MSSSKDRTSFPAARAGRRLAAALAALSVSLVVCVGSASAKQVYDYVYSGTFIDGTGSTNGTFPGTVAGPGYDAAAERLLVPVGFPEPGYVSKFTKTGTPSPFSALSSDTLVPSSGSFGFGSGPEINIDNTGGPTDGRIYVNNLAAFGGSIFSYNRDGSPTGANFETFFNQWCGMSVGPDGDVWASGRIPFQANSAESGLARYSPDGELKEYIGLIGPLNNACRLEIDTEGNMYISPGSFGTGVPYKLNEKGELLYPLPPSVTAQNFGIDRSNDDVFVMGTGFENVVIRQYDKNGALLEEFGPADPSHSFLGLQGAVGNIAVDPVTHDVWVANRRDYGGEVRHIEKFERSAPITVPTLTVEAPESSPTSATLRGTLNADGLATTDCHFEFGTNVNFGVSIPCDEGNVFEGSGDNVVTAPVTELVKGSTYWYRLSAKNGNERVAYSGPRKFIAQGAPVLGVVTAKKVNTDGAELHASIDPNGGNTTYHFEYGTEAGVYDHSTPESESFGLIEVEDVVETLNGLTAGTTYHYRIVATNEAGTTVGEDQTFSTYVPDPATDPCANAEVRQQTESSLLLDCRAYELVSAGNAGGYDVVSDLTPGTGPYVASPGADDRAVYSVDHGVIPGVAGSPTNFGRDPYLAVRGPDGWSTSYVGIPSHGLGDPGSYGSPLLGADRDLSTFAFGGPDICEPCFPDGSTNIPMRRDGGALEKGMAGSMSPKADPTGEVRKWFSADGRFFVFSSDKQFETAANSGTQWIYKRNLVANTTQLVSTATNGTPLTGEVAALDVSDDGSRVLVGQLVDTDAEGNRYFDLYMHTGGSSNSVKVVDTANGVLYGGMTDDGSRVFFTTFDQLDDDADASADLFRADVSGTTSTISRVSTGSGGTGNTDACEPIADWNVVSGGPDCSVVAIAGGGGVASDAGTVYFFSPERLDGPGNGVQDQPNLYVAETDEDPEFVATIDSSLVKPGPQPPKHPLQNASFISGLANPEALAVDQSTGDLYVLERGVGSVARYTSAGAAKPFAAGPNAGGNKITGLSLGGTAEAQVAFDSAPSSPLKDSFYVRSNSSTLAVYSTSGEKLGELSGFGEACGVAVDQSNGNLYVGDWSYAGVRKLVPKASAAAPIDKEDYEAETSIKTQMNPCQIGVDTGGRVYASAYSSGPLRVYSDAAFAAVPPSLPGVQIGISPANGLQTNPATDELLVAAGNRIALFDNAGQLIEEAGVGQLSGSRGVAVDAGSGVVYAASGGGIAKFSVQITPYEPIDNPAVRHGVLDSEARSFEDFQVTPDGRYAAFSSVLSLTGYPNFLYSEIYRYDVDENLIDCASCAPTGSAPSSDVRLSRYGLNLSDDGRVFFTTRESFALRDTNERLDTYEWAKEDGAPNGTTQLISRGTGGENSSLFSVSADGRNVFFFTRDKLVPEDQNGNTVKLYTAREDGGYLFDPPRLPCAASDECHGAGTQPPPPPAISTVTGSGRATKPPAKAKRCKKGFVKKKGKCVRKHKKARKNRKRRRAAKGRG